MISPEGIPELSPKQTFELIGKVNIIDVRRPDEFVGELGHVESARLVTLESQLSTELPKLPKDETYIFVCRSGGRSGNATALAQSLGIKKCYNMQGGMLRWNAEKLPTKR